MKSPVIFRSPTLASARRPIALCSLSRRLLLLGLFPLLAAGCSKSEPKGLILGFSSFDGRPLPSEMGILRPGKGILVPVDGSRNGVAKWTFELIQDSARPLQVALGETSEGKTVLGRLDENGERIGGPMRHSLIDGKWELAPVEGLSEGDVTWERGPAEEGEDGPGPTKTKDYELDAGNTFHKAFWFEPAFGEPGILTISANMPMIKIWRQSGNSWNSELLFTADVGNREHRFRDIEVGDVDGDGQEELVLATHDLGRVFVLEQKADGLEAIEIASRDELTFVHEIELGDVDGDGMDEIFSTPSDPNALNGKHQRGQIERHDFEDGKWRLTTVEDSETTHAKEILIADIEQDGQLELYSAMEGEGLTGLDSRAAGGASTQIKRYDFDGDSSTDQIVAELPSNLCRFLNLGDLEGDGQLEILASTRSEGIYRVWFEGGEWKSQSEINGLQTAGFEHSTVFYDIDGNGSDELFVADDENKRIQMWYWDAGRERMRKVVLLDRSDQFYLTWSVMPLR